MKENLYKVIHGAGFLAAVAAIPLLGFDLKTLVSEESLSLPLVVSAAEKVVLIILFLAASGGVFDALFARLIKDDPRRFIPFTALLSPKKKTLYKVFIEWGGVFFIVALFTFDWLSYDMGLIYTQIIGIPDLQIILMTGFLLLFQKKILQMDVLAFLVASLFLVVFSKLQGFGVMTTFQGFKDYFSVIWLYFFFKYFPFKNATIVKGVRLVKFFVLLQLPVQIVQYVILRDVESCSGTFGFHQTGVLGIFMAAVVLYIVSTQKLNLKNILLIIYISLSPLLGSARFFFIFNFFLAPFILIKKYRIRASGKLVLVLLLLCLVFVGLLQMNKFWYEEGNISGLNPFYFLSGAYLRDLVAVTGSTLPRGGAIVWTYRTLIDEGRLLFGRGIGWRRSLSPVEFQYFKKLRIANDFPMMFLLCGLLGLTIFFYLAWNIFKMRIRIKPAPPELKFFFLCLTGLYLIGGIYTQGWASKTTGYCFAMIIGLLSNRENRAFFIEKYLMPKAGRA